MKSNSNLRNEYIIELKSVKKIINSKVILDNINFSCLPNVFLAIMGPSGAGKSTLLNVSSGLEPTTEGEVIINQTYVNKLKEPKLTKFRRKNISYIFQNYGLIEYLNVQDNIMLPQKLMHQSVDKKRLSVIIHQVGLSGMEKKMVNGLSGGQQQRVSIARALIGNNPIIFADEPTGALDLATRDAVIKLLKESTALFKKTLIVVTHDPKVASYADQIVYLLNGKINAVQPPMSPEAIGQKLLELERDV